jgi:hypothetical protein
MNMNQNRSVNMNQNRSFSRNIADWVFPPNIEEKIKYSNVFLRSLFLTNQGNNHELGKRHLGERCFILATGPSINSQNLKPLKKETCIAVSNFFVHPDYQTIQPRYHCLAPYHPPIEEEAWQSWLDKLNQSLDKTELFFSSSDIHRNEAPNRFDESKRYYLNFSGAWSFSEAHGIDLNKPLPGPQSVTIIALYIAIYMGFSEIYLLGCDHDWILHINESRHFYQEQKHELVRKGYSEWYTEDLEAHCRDYIKLWQSYKKIQSIAIKDGIKIFNATNKGLLDIFPTVLYESLLSG